MASQKLTALTALTAPQPEDLAYIVDDVAGTPVERKITLANLLGNAGETQTFGWSDAAITRSAAGRIGMPAVTLTQGTITADAPILNGSVTWNNAAVKFTGMRLNVTRTASASGSLLADLQADSQSWFQFGDSGSNYPVLAMRAGASFSGFASNTASLFDIFVGASAINNFGTAITVRIESGNIRIRSGSSFQWASTASANGSPDLSLFRDAANQLAQRNGTNAQTSRLYGTFTNDSNYRRVALAMTTAGVATLQAEGAGTGASGNVLHISSLPTSNPGPGILWNNAGDPAIGT
jgi:hypothetical protein